MKHLQFYVGRFLNVAQILGPLCRCSVFDILHPREFASKVEEMRQMADKSISNILAACPTNEPLSFKYWTNHVDVLDYLSYNEVWFVGEDGIEKRAWEHPDYELWKDEFKPGEFWSVFGDNWQSVNLIPNSPETQARLNEIIGGEPEQGNIVYKEKGENPLSEHFTPVRLADCEERA